MLDTWCQRSTSVSRVGAQWLTEQHHSVYLRVAFNFWKEYKEDSHRLQFYGILITLFVTPPILCRWRNWNSQRLNSFSRVTIIPGGQGTYLLVHSWSTLYPWGYICTSSHGNGVREDTWMEPPTSHRLLELESKPSLNHFPLVIKNLPFTKSFQKLKVGRALF